MTKPNKNQHTLRRYIGFILSLFVIAFGTSLSIRANLGCSPISSPPYVLSLIPNMPLSMGTLVFCMHILMISIQIAILRRRYNPFQLLQLAVAVVFGLFTDLTMWMTNPMQIDSSSFLGYGMRLIELLIGGAILAYGIAMEVKCDVLMLATEGTQVVIARETGIEFSRVKIVTDTMLVAIAAILMLSFFHHWNWTMVGIGTIISMYYVGRMVKIFNPTLAWLDKFILG